MLDGNAIAGMLEDIFGADMTTAACTCAGCGRRGSVAETTVYLYAPGVVVRCPQCDAVLAVVVERRTVYCVDLNGMSALGSP
jgi:Family of unknown function (DUF6510)